MIRTIMQRGLPLLGLVLLAGLIVFQLWFETKGREMFFSEQVVMLTGEAARGDQISDGDWYYAKVPKDTVIDTVITDPSLIVGKVAKQYIPFKAQLSPTFFEDAELVTTSDQFMMKIPNEWVYALPNTLRARDKIVLKEIPRSVLEREKQADAAANDPSVVPSPSPEPAEGDASELPETYDPKAAGAVAGKAGEIVLKATVAYVKDSSNREVQSISSMDRKDGTSVIRDIEVVVSVDDVNKLEQYIEAGSKFLIMYQEGE
ncbi:hypothetical protein B8V81_5065 [Paenibacillus pasadenensis]|uniref:SAF domain-containing protein n=1 Tax=Paenibacillus pasadenensis TaxID=217090 RepID=A0A2N5MZL1_9BACL|nr:SAF domain-containing protein [Paenibacillus pasadenensis]PLT43525.1 hypothetical protein B8V81_5065 [Paenibacillus pasadenensis]